MRRPLLLVLLLAGCAADADGAATKCPLVRASCPYMGYGTGCSPVCTTPPSCVFAFEVDWGSFYCCGTPVETYSDCACEDGRVKCRNYPTEPRTVPRTYCEFCGRDASALP